jgi:hypothetical protein
MTQMPAVNPTMFIINNPDDPRLPQDRNHDFHVSLIRDFGCIYGSPYRHGEFWEEECFICPNCAHATLLAANEDSPYTDSFFCKYCYSDWVRNPKDTISLLRVELAD